MVVNICGNAEDVYDFKDFRRLVEKYMGREAAWYLDKIISEKNNHIEELEDELFFLDHYTPYSKY